MYKERTELDNICRDGLLIQSETNDNLKILLMGKFNPTVGLTDKWNEMKF